MSDVLRAAIDNVILDPIVMVTILLSCVYGIFVGAIPGLTATMAVALMVPLTFFMGDVQAIAAIVTTTTCSIFAGDIPATLVRIPGTPASAAYASDSYQLAQNGQYSRILSISLLFSVIGGLFGVGVLSLAAPKLARLATQFGNYEYFWLFALGLTCAAVVSDGPRSRGIVALLIGLLLSTVGLGQDYSTPRLTFGSDELITGINFIPAMIGLFGLSEVLRNVSVVDQEKSGPRVDAKREIPTTVIDVIPLALKRWVSLVRSSSIGAVIGMLPGAGADIAAWIAYAVSKRFSRKPGLYGKGSEEGVADATGANNAALGSAWIPALVFGIPGDSVTAIAIGVLLMKNITPGPQIFLGDVSNSATVLGYSIYVTFVVANILLIPIGWLAIRLSGMLVNVPRRVLMPPVVLFCILGSYAMSASYFDVWVMLSMGLLGFVLERFRIPLGPVVLGIILGPELEHRFVQCISNSTDVSLFLGSYISKLLAFAVVLLWMSPLLFSQTKRKPRRSVPNVA
ncbi:MAG: tripartite tricarboxylate transporter permease [Planctomycetales bacterium]|nr:tripartite tricarboxylate transporter permease [Planctomycetales bacterium]